jgi:CRP-like cAMP-binding protein
MIGREGVVGTPALVGLGRAINGCIVQVAGKAYGVSLERFEHAMVRSRQLRDYIARFDANLMAQAQQAAACNANHSAQARVCRWLLELRDRCDDNVVPLTQGFLAHMVGVQRTTVTLAASRLQAAGAIRCRRGKVSILDAAKLESEACDCYERMRTLREKMAPTGKYESVERAPAIVQAASHNKLTEQERAL